MNNNIIYCQQHTQNTIANQTSNSRHNNSNHHFRYLRKVNNPAEIHKAIIRYQFNEVFEPQWFGSIQWQPFIADYTTAVKETRHFRNKFLCSLLDTKLKKLPEPPLRPRIIWFHERELILINPRQPKNPRYKLAYHTHFHLEECPDPYTCFVKLDWLFRSKVAKDFKRLSTNDSAENKGFVLKEWKKDHHANYNFKDYFKYKNHQDADLVLDIENSDLQFPIN